MTQQKMWQKSCRIFFDLQIRLSCDSQIGRWEASGYDSAWNSYWSPKRLQTVVCHIETTCGSEILSKNNLEGFNRCALSKRTRFLWIISVLSRAKQEYRACVHEDIDEYHWLTFSCLLRKDVERCFLISWDIQDAVILLEHYLVSPVRVSQMEKFVWRETSKVYCSSESTSSWHKFVLRRSERIKTTHGTFFCVRFLPYSPLFPISYDEDDVSEVRTFSTCIYDSRPWFSWRLRSIFMSKIAKEERRLTAAHRPSVISLTSDACGDLIRTDPFNAIRNKSSPQWCATAHVRCFLVRYRHENGFAYQNKSISLQLSYMSSLWIGFWFLLLMCFSSCIGVFVDDSLTPNVADLIDERNQECISAAPEQQHRSCFRERVLCISRTYSARKCVNKQRSSRYLDYLQIRVRFRWPMTSQQRFSLLAFYCWLRKKHKYLMRINRAYLFGLIYHRRGQAGLCPHCHDEVCWCFAPLWCGIFIFRSASYPRLVVLSMMVSCSKEREKHDDTAFDHVCWLPFVSCKGHICSLCTFPLSHSLFPTGNHIEHMTHPLQSANQNASPKYLTSQRMTHPYFVDHLLRRKIFLSSSSRFSLSLSFFSTIYKYRTVCI